MTRRRSLTMEDIARLAKVSKPTVSRALSGSPLVSEETRRQVLEVAAAHGYVVNPNARRLRQSRSDTIAVVLDFGSHRANRISDPFIFNLLAGVSEALGQRNQDLLLVSPGHAAIGSLGALRSAKGVDGIIFLGQGDRGEELIALADSDVPFVVWGAVDPALPYCAIGSDNVRGGFLAGQHLLERGRRHFLFVGNPRHQELRQRRDGLAQALAESGTATVLEDLSMEDFSYGSALRMALSRIASSASIPDAVFAASDTAAMAFITALQQSGHSVPVDVSVVGYNDIPPAEHFHPPLTTVHQDVHAAGALLVEKLMLAIDGRRPHSVMLDTRLIIRESS